MKTFPTLYKKNKDGSIQFWEVSVSLLFRCPDSDVAIKSKFGRVDGAVQESIDIIKEGKNIGRSNETTKYEQACAEAESKWLGKKKRGYVEEVDDAEAGKRDTVIAGGIDPMLAHPYAKYGGKIAFPAYAQPKLDGIRCTATVIDGVVSLWTRTRKPIVSMQHIIDDIKSFCMANAIENFVFDGELYNHDYRDRFEDIVSLVRPDYVKPGAEIVEYHIYDAAIDGTFEDRLYDMVTLFENLDAGNYGRLELVETMIVNDEDELMTAFEHFRAEGYEGAIVRNKDGLYANRRSYDLQKIKEFDEAEFEIVGVEEGRGKMAGKGIFICKTESGEMFKVKQEGCLASLKLDGLRSDIGKQLTVKYQGLTGKNGVPRFPIGKTVRDYE